MSHVVTENEIEFDSLSSGEKQLIYSTSTVLYHLNNINSVTKDSERRKYMNLNIIFEEIELYFHPEFQRKYISYLLESIDNLQLNNKGIKNLNIIFVTHSPFILSDIPMQNILFLELKEDKINNEIGVIKIRKTSHPKINTNKTFASNIHDLLADNFFMNNGFLGEYAKITIKEIIDFLSTKKKSKKWNKENTKIFIEQIGEELLRNSLNELYYIKFPNEIDKQIIRLQKIKNKK